MKQSEALKDKIFFYRSGKFTIKPRQAWHEAVLEAGGDIKQGLKTVGCHEYMEEIVEANYESDYASVKVWETPEDGLLVLFITSRHDEVFSVFIPDKTDWLPFYASYVLPFIQAQATVRLVNYRIPLLEELVIDIRNKRWPAAE